VKNYYVYILASKRNGTLYTGFTSDLLGRVDAHKKRLIDGFTKKYSVDRLVWYETFDSFEDALIFEKRLKKWRRQWKLELIEKLNPNWDDLFFSLLSY